MSPVTWSCTPTGRALTVDVPGHCPVRVAATSHAQPASGLRALPEYSITGLTTQVGYDAPVALDLMVGCPEAEPDTVHWRQTDGLALAAWSLDSTGRRLRAQTLPLSVFHPQPLPHGVLPLSPRTQGRYTVEATMKRRGRPDVRLRTTLTSAARSTGMSSVAVSQRRWTAADRSVTPGPKS